MDTFGASFGGVDDCAAVADAFDGVSAPFDSFSGESMKLLHGVEPFDSFSREPGGAASVFCCSDLAFGDPSASWGAADEDATDDRASG